LTPEQLFLQPFYWVETSKKDRAQLIKDLLATNKEKFYELDFFQKNFYYNIIEIFSAEEDQPIFMELTEEVIKDILSMDYDKQNDAFVQTVLNLLIV
jgi:hypothetical protein